MKRRSVCDTDNEDEMFDDEDSINERTGSPTQSCHVPDRKRRRGIIEKRRRDRINNSLTELKRLIPAAFEKQGSAKLEKAEILKMTVDHLKIMQQSKNPPYGLDTSALAMDFRGVGFRECAAEVARYLMTFEGLDSQDPLCVRLLSHLQYYSAQKSSPVTRPSQVAQFQQSGWNQNVHLANAQYTKPLVTSYSHIRQMDSNVGTSSGSLMDCGARFQHQVPSDSAAAAAAEERMSGYPGLFFPTPNLANMATSGGVGLPDQGQMSQASSALSGLAQVQFFGLNNSQQGSNYNLSTSSASALLNDLKPYRPWGSSLAY